ncbi:PAAR domain-containing protein [Luteimonas terrae]|uniref:Zn-binding protein involved in type VI secretion n=1 Tax=Luteimonas terrae TaxID=1530191 RepID=A0ABU1XV41_9GAMM|nr:PAAR domain-containing protein [Luteimonas terrae]MDR7192622.1 putative Zn-binding protein involved in type VI secretion [Luteimonas terrae]
MDGLIHFKDQKLMSRPLIVLGDSIDHGGTVVGGTPTTDVAGKPVARVGDPVTCSKHGATTIATGDPTLMVDGRAVARHGDRTACGATLLSSQSSTVD